MFSNIVFIALINIFKKIKTERWFDPVTGYNTYDFDNGFAGSSNEPAIDFYLCGERKYRVHFLDDPPSNWSQNFSNCDPVGNGRKIDGICIYTTKSYKVRLHNGNWWTRIIKGCNISNHKDGYTGKLGSPLSCIAINGGNPYRIASVIIGQNFISSNPKNSSDRIIEKIFGKNVKNFANYNEEYELDLSAETNNNNKFYNFRAKIILINNTNLNLDGDGIKFIVHKKNINYSFWGGNEINKNFNKQLKNIINFDINEERKKFEKIISNEIDYGIFIIHTFYKEKKIQIDIGIKIMPDVEGFRGGIRINLILINNIEFINIIKKIIELISRYINTRGTILDELKSFNSIEQLDKIIRLIAPFDIILNQIIFLYLLHKQ